MPDITMCRNYECPKRRSCYRYTAEPSEYRQSYTVYAVTVCGELAYCQNFIPNGETGDWEE